ncbi:hypothetical protein [Candidatus Protochlamydia amoebophila]|uniref:hypothetical protein n=1 Tax=Candidatus Protochlamydia amoebophila TaxID=362787 RepID=UPI00057E5252|nr:hypothetical protein [Candidatus Protochlamydia amoebophila]
MYLFHEGYAENVVLPYQFIGYQEAAIPTHFFKVLTLKDWQGRQEIKGSILTNQPICSLQSI